MYYRGTGGTLPQWKDFEVICTVKTENKGNSGIFLHASPGTPDKNRADGIEVQVWNDASQGTTGLTGSLQRVASTTTTRIRRLIVRTEVDGSNSTIPASRPATNSPYSSESGSESNKASTAHQETRYRSKQPLGELQHSFREPW